MTLEDLKDWRTDFEEYVARFAEIYPRPQTRAHASEYVLGLMSPLERKNGWRLAEHAGHSSPDELQRLLYRSTWSSEQALDVMLEFVNERFGVSDAIVVLDETGFIKKGRHSVGVQRQYSGTAGKVDNCQIAVFASYVSSKTHLLVDRRLYLPKSWVDDRPRCRAAEVPDGIDYRSKPQLAVEMLEHLIQRRLPFAWVSADEVYGNAGHLRQAIAAMGKRYVLAISSTTKGWRKRPPTIAPDEEPPDGQKRHNGRPRVRRRLAPDAPAPQTVQSITEALPDRSWTRLSLFDGEKGPRQYDWVAKRLVVWCDEADGEELWLLARRSIEQPRQIAYYLSNAPRSTPIEEMARVAMQRYTIEQCFEEAKSDLGMDHYEVRSWPSWHRHLTLTMMAMSWLAHMRASYQKTGGSRRIAPFDRGRSGRVDDR